jgi:hypothetical protein
LVLLLHNSEGIDEFLDHLQRLLNRVIILVVGLLVAFDLSFASFSIKILLQFDDLVG